ncbi:MAG: hypothetical protein OXD34_14310 [bacterium]|nr:hypothetical protein [bacterium]
MAFVASTPGAILEPQELTAYGGDSFTIMQLRLPSRIVNRYCTVGYALDEPVRATRRGSGDRCSVRLMTGRLPERPAPRP